MADVPHVAAGLASTFPVVVAEESGRGRLPRLQGQLPLRSSEPHLGSRGHPSSRQCSGELVSKPDNYRRNVTDAAAWADAHSGLVQFIFDEFKRTGAWPELDTLQRDLDRRDAGIDVERELREMPPSLGGGGYPDPVSLSLRGLSHVADAEPLLSGYMRLVQLAVERYRGDDPSPTITDQDVRELGFDAPAALLVSQIVFRERWPFGGGSGYPAGPWTREVGRDVRYVQGGHDW